VLDLCGFSVNRGEYNACMMFLRLSDFQQPACSGQLCILACVIKD